MVFICGPIIGGFLEDAFGMRDSCLKMAIFGVVFLLLYTLASIYVYFTSFNDDMISLDDSIECDLNRSRGDELARLLRTLTEDKFEKSSLIKKRKNYGGSISGILGKSEIETLDNDSDQDCEGPQ